MYAEAGVAPPGHPAADPSPMSRRSKSITSDHATTIGPPALPQVSATRRPLRPAVTRNQIEPAYVAFWSWTDAGGSPGSSVAAVVSPGTAVVPVGLAGAATAWAAASASLAGGAARAGAAAARATVSARRSGARRTPRR